MAASSLVDLSITAPPLVRQARALFSCAGVSVSVEASSSIMSRIPIDFIPVTSATPNPAKIDIAFTVIENTGSFEVLQEGHSCGRYQSWTETSEVLQGKVHEAIAARATDLIFVHSGVVVYRNQAILIPGRSFAGKTTLTMALVEAGATYYSDEYALVNSQGLVYPFPRTPHVRQQIATVSHLQIPPNRPLPVGLVIMSSYDENASWQPEKLSISQCLFGLIDNSVGIQSHPEIYLRCLKQVATTSAAYASLRGEARPVAQAILNLLKSSNKLGATN